MGKLTCCVVAAGLIAIGCGGSDSTVIASGLNEPLALTVSGGTLFWIEDASNGNGESPANSTIRSMPISGGKPTTLVTQPYLDGNLTTDGTKLYFSYTPPGSQTSTIASCGLDGSNVTTLTTSIFVWGSNAGGAFTEMFAVNGTLYVMGQPCNSASSCSDPINTEQPYSVPASGGGSDILYNLPVTAQPLVVSTGDNLVYADSSGVYYTWLQTVNGVGTYYLSNGNTQITSVPVASITAANGLPLPNVGSLTVVNGTAYYLAKEPSSNGITLFSFGAGGGMPSAVATFQNQNGQYVVGDSNGLYVNNQVASNSPGIYSVSLTGTQKSIYVDNKFAFSTSVGNDRILALDSTNVYWVGGGFNAGQGEIHKLAR
jgi:hypothetical protein